MFHSLITQKAYSVPAYLFDLICINIYKLKILTFNSDVMVLHFFQDIAEKIFTRKAPAVWDYRGSGGVGGMEVDGISIIAVDPSIPGWLHFILIRLPCPTSHTIAGVPPVESLAGGGLTPPPVSFSFTGSGTGTIGKYR